MGGELRLSVCVQHHPRRADLLEALLERLGEAEVVEDPEPNGKPSPLRCYRECLLRTPEWATHRLVVQDDAWPCDDFRSLAETAIAERPDALVSFYVGGSPGGGGNRVLLAAKRREPWARISGATWTNTVALVWPVAQIEPFLKFAEHKRWERQTGDDPVVGRFAQRSRLEVWATVPSLVEHPDRVPSLIGRKHGAGRRRNRVAQLFIDRT